MVSTNVLPLVDGDEVATTLIASSHSLRHHVCRSTLNLTRSMALKIDRGAGVIVADSVMTWLIIPGPNGWRCRMGGERALSQL